jgi:hypothetical protein
MIESQIESPLSIGGMWVPADPAQISEIVNPPNPSEIIGTTQDLGKCGAF